MERMHDGLLVVERFELDSKDQGNFPTSSGIRMRDVLKKFRGIDGTYPWPEAPSLQHIHLDEVGLASLDQYHIVWEYFQDVNSHSWCDLLYVQNVKTIHAAFSHQDFQFCGYDFGHYGGLGNHFSVLLHEVINGQYAQLRHYVDVLNDHLLLPSLRDADALKATREVLKSEGAGLETEDDEEFVPIGIYISKKLVQRENRE